MTVLEAIQRSAEYLAGKGVDSPRLQAELLLADVLKAPRMQLYLRFERALQEPEVAALRERVKRRARREPLQHILGTAIFCGLEMEVNPSVLVPRPETELLAEMAWRFAGERGPKARVLDFGTGSGCLAIAVAAHCPEAEVVAADISADALVVATRNVARHGLEARVRLLQSDGFSNIPADRAFQLVVTNPPYIPAADLEGLQPEVRDFDPRQALDGGADGLRFYRLLAQEAGDRLAPGGRLMAEFGDGQEGGIRELFEAQNWIVEAIHPDYNRTPRILVARRD